MKNHDQQENPFVSIMTSRNLTRRDLAIICDVDYITVCQALQAFYLRPSRKLLSGLEALGYDPAFIQAQYIEFRMKRREALLASQLEENGVA